MEEAVFDDAGLPKFSSHAENNFKNAVDFPDPPSPVLAMRDSTKHESGSDAESINLENEFASLLDELTSYQEEIKIHFESRTAKIKEEYQNGDVETDESIKDCESVTKSIKSDQELEQGNGISSPSAGIIESEKEPIKSDQELEQGNGISSPSAGIIESEKEPIKSDQELEQGNGISSPSAGIIESAKESTIAKDCDIEQQELGKNDLIKADIHQDLEALVHSTASVEDQEHWENQNYDRDAEDNVRTSGSCESDANPDGDPLLTELNKKASLKIKFGTFDKNSSSESSSGSSSTSSDPSSTSSHSSSSTSSSSLSNNKSEHNEYVNNNANTDNNENVDNNENIDNNKHVDNTENIDNNENVDNYVNKDSDTNSSISDNVFKDPIKAVLNYEDQDSEASDSENSSRNDLEAIQLEQNNYQELESSEADEDHNTSDATDEIEDETTPNVEIILPIDTVYPGKLIKGFVKIDSGVSISSSFFSLLCEGQESAEWEATVIKNSVTQREKHFASKMFFSDYVDLIHQDCGGSFILYRFSYQLPPHLPGSFHITKAGPVDIKGVIEYSLVLLDTQENKTIHKVKFNVVEFPAHSHMPNVVTDSLQSYYLKCFKKGEVKLVAELDKSCYSFNENIQIRCRITNSASICIPYLNIELHRNLCFRDDNFGEIKLHRVIKSQQFKDGDSSKPSKFFETILKLPLDKIELQTVSNSRIIACSYAIHVMANLKSNELLKTILPVILIECGHAHDETALSPLMTIKELTNSMKKNEIEEAEKPDNGFVVNAINL